jgi:hypothetical protein
MMGGPGPIRQLLWSSNKPTWKPTAMLWTAHRGATWLGVGFLLLLKATFGWQLTRTSVLWLPGNWILPTNWVRSEEQQEWDENIAVVSTLMSALWDPECRTQQLRIQTQNHRNWGGKRVWFFRSQCAVWCCAAIDNKYKFKSFPI